VEARRAPVLRISVLRKMERRVLGCAFMAFAPRSLLCAVPRDGKAKSGGRESRFVTETYRIMGGPKSEG
jgi:hypothetical protein